MLKDNLLLTGAFINNEYIDKYIKIVNAPSISGYSENHHIIPQKYFKLLGLPIDNSKTNTVRLSAYNHIYAHYLLCFCTNGKLNKSCIKAFLLMTQYNTRLLTAEEQLTLTKLNLYATLRETAQLDISKTNSIKFKGRKVTVETKQKISIANKGKAKPQRTAAHIEHLRLSRDTHSTTAGRKSIYNAELNKVKFVFEMDLPEYLAAGWKLGGKPLSDDAKKKIGKSNSVALKGKVHQQAQAGKHSGGLVGNKVICVETNQVFTNIDSAKQWLKATTGVEGGQIKNCCAGKRTTTGGYHWKYYMKK